LTVALVLADVPVGDLPAGARMRVGDEALLEVGPAASVSRAAEAGRGLLEAGETMARPAEVLEGGLVRPGDAVTLESVTVPLTDVLDLHSFRPDEVPAVVTEYLAEARRAGLAEVRIVHGRGRGVQRAAVRRALVGAPGVTGFADAAPVRGGWGATVVRLGRPPSAAE
jgi:DNA-nicking Smr family endonuclease